LPTPPPLATLETDGSDNDYTSPHGESGELVTVARFSNRLKANVLRACLESHGLDVLLWGEHLGTVHVIWSVAGGGMRIQGRAASLRRRKNSLRLGTW